MKTVTMATGGLAAWAQAWRSVVMCIEYVVECYDASWDDGDLDILCTSGLCGSEYY